MAKIHPLKQFKSFRALEKRVRVERVKAVRAEPAIQGVRLVERFQGPLTLCLMCLCTLLVASVPFAVCAPTSAVDVVSSFLLESHCFLPLIFVLFFTVVLVFWMVVAGVSFEPHVSFELQRREAAFQAAKDPRLIRFEALARLRSSLLADAELGAEGYRDPSGRSRVRVQLAHEVEDLERSLAKPHAAVSLALNLYEEPEPADKVLARTIEAFYADLLTRFEAASR